MQMLKCIISKEGDAGTRTRRQPHLSGVPNPFSEAIGVDLGLSTGEDAATAASVLGGGARMNRRCGLDLVGRVMVGAPPAPPPEDAPGAADGASAGFREVAGEDEMLSLIHI